MNWSRHQRGYTMIELVVAMTIFAVVIVVAVGAFVSVQRTSQKTAAQRKVQQDTRYNLEQLTRQIRSGRIDYSFYQQNAADIQCNVDGRRMLALFVVEASTPVPKRVFYWYQASGQTLYSLVQSNVSVVPTCGEVMADTAKAKQIADGIVLTDLQFFVMPLRDPLNSAETDATIRNTHPRVTVLWGAQTGNTTQPTQEFDQVRLETTVSTRSYPISQTVGGQSATPPPAPSPPPSPPPAGASWTSPGRDFTNCSPPGNPNYYCNASDPDGITVFSYEEVTWRYITTSLQAGRYQLTLTYKNAGTQPLPRRYDEYEIESTLNGGRRTRYNLPVSDPAQTPRTFTTTVTLPAGTSVLDLRWRNDEFEPPADANFALSRVTLTRTGP